MTDAGDRLRAAARGALAATVWLNVAVSALALLGAGWPPLDTFSDLAPMWVATSLALLAATALVSVKRTTLGGAMLAALASTFLIAPELIAAARPTPPAPASAPQLTLITINLWSANLSLATVEQLIRTENPDIIVAQEAWPPWKGFLESLAPEYRLQAGCRYDSDCNVVILSRLRLIQVVAAPDNGIAAIRLELPARFGAGAVDVLGVHLTRPGSRAAAHDQIAQVAAMGARLAPSVLAAGDFNTTPWSRLRTLDRALPATRRTRAMLTWPTPTRTFTPLQLRSPTAIAAIDHVYASDDWRVVAVRRGPDVGSDHYPIIASFALERGD
jgi:endonuclease/exonuclease/phosphatase (EEP) superfamily protein YafD